MSSKKLTISQCLPLVEKITERIRCWSAKCLSYDGRIKLIKSVIFGMQTYWAQIFVLPKRMLKMIEALCRTYLWTSSVVRSRKALVSWEKLCLPKAAGGQNIINLSLWNTAASVKKSPLIYGFEM